MRHKKRLGAKERLQSNNRQIEWKLVRAGCLVCGQRFAVVIQVEWPGTKRLYAKKAQYFVDLGTVRQIDGTADMLRILRDAGIKRVLVTGSGQDSLLRRLNDDYPMTFADDMRVTARDVSHGKPSPEPYLKGLEKAGEPAGSTIVVENAPLGVQAGHASGCFTVGITTGPIPADELYSHGADIVYPDMKHFAAALPEIIALRKH